MTLIGCVLMFRIDTLEQRQIHGTDTTMSVPTLSPATSDTSGTVTVIVLDGSTSPSIAIASEIGSTVPAGSVGRLMFAWNATP